MQCSFFFSNKNAQIQSSERWIKFQRLRYERYSCAMNKIPQRNKSDKQQKHYVSLAFLRSNSTREEFTLNASDKEHALDSLIPQSVEWEVVVDNNQ